MGQNEREMVRQSDDLITVLAGETPIISCSREEVHEEVVKGINFLRSGCPSVQFFLTHEVDDRQDWFRDLKSIVESLQLSHETFSWEWDSQHLVFLLKRTLK
jgi:hypothetical protein